MSHSDKKFVHIIMVLQTLYTGCFAPCVQKMIERDIHYYRLLCFRSNLYEVPSFDSPNIKEIHLDYNLIKTISNFQFKFHKDLKALYLDYNLINLIPPRAFQGTKLKKLELNNNPLLCLPDLSVVRMTLHSLRASYTYVGKCYKDVEYAKAFPALQTVHLTHAQLTKLPSIVSVAPKLDQLNIENNDLQTLPRFKGCKFLNKLARELRDCTGSQISLGIAGNPLKCNDKLCWLADPSITNDKNFTCAEINCKDPEKCCFTDDLLYADMEPRVPVLDQFKAGRKRQMSQEKKSSEKRKTEYASGACFVSVYFSINVLILLKSYVLQ